MKLDLTEPSERRRAARLLRKERHKSKRFNLPAFGGFFWIGFLDAVWIEHNRAVDHENLAYAGILKKVYWSAARLVSRRVSCES